jgi:hypothetical protein
VAFGDGSHDQALRDGWSAFCDRLRAAGDRAFKDHNPATPLHRADAFRFLMQNLGQAFDLALETRDTRYPEIHTFCTPNCKLGGDAADLLYQQAWIDGTSVYRISGQLGSARFLNITVQGPRPDTIPGTDWPSLHEPFGDIPEANLLGTQLRCEADGRFELYVGGSERGPNWLPTTPGSRKLFVRQGFDRWDETPARLFIERVDMDSPRPLPTPEVLVEAMEWAGDFVTGLMHDWPDHPYRYSGGVVDPTCENAFPRDRQADGADDRKRGRAAAHMCWRLAPEQALVVELDDLDSFWMVSCAGVFFNSMDYLYRPVSYTPSRVRTDPDGKLRLVLCHADPGYAHWIDTQGFERGGLTWRNFLSEASTEFATQLVPRDALPDVMPSGSAIVSSEERRAQLWERFHGIRRRYRL